MYILQLNETFFIYNKKKVVFNISIHSTETTALRIIYVLSVKYNVESCQIKSMLHVLLTHKYKLMKHT